MIAAIYRPIEVNGVCFRALEKAAQAATIHGAHALVNAALRGSRIYRVERGVDYVAVHSQFHRKQLAVVS